MIKLKNILQEANIDMDRVFMHGSSRDELRDQEITPEIMEKQLKQVTGQPVDVSERDPGEFRAQWTYMRRELPTSDWNEAIKFIQEQGGKIDKARTLNDYEKNWEPEEPAEWVPTIYFKL